MRVRSQTVQIAKPNGAGVDHFCIYPAASLLVKKWVTRGVAKGTIAREDVVVCSAAIIASGIAGARGRGARTICTQDVRNGWRDILAYDLCVRQWQCLSRSITGRMDLVRDRLPMVDELIDQFR